MFMALRTNIDDKICEFRTLQHYEMVVRPSNWARIPRARTVPMRSRNEGLLRERVHLCAAVPAGRPGPTTKVAQKGPSGGDTAVSYFRRPRRSTSLENSDSPGGQARGCKHTQPHCRRNPTNRRGRAPSLYVFGREVSLKPFGIERSDWLAAVVGAR